MNKLILLTQSNSLKEELQDLELNKFMSKLSKLWDDFWPKALHFLFLLLISLLIYVVGKKLIKLLVKIVRKTFERAKMDVGVSNFLISVLKAICYGLLLFTMAATLGLPTTSFVALLGSIGLTIGLALQGSLSNFAGGVLILILKPFRVGDFINVKGNEGTVIAIDIFYTKILTIENKLVVLPNGTLANSEITNATNEPIRRLDLIIPIGYDDDIKSVKQELFLISQRNDKILMDHPVDLFVSGYGKDAVEISMRVWVKTEDCFVLKGELLETIKYMFDEKGFTIPFNQMDVTVVSEKVAK
nr:mechanosensitive ion channel domain-containing protein [uncultured Lachnoclostridium sp.]